MANKYIEEERERQDARTINAFWEMLARNITEYVYNKFRKIVGVIGLFCAIIFGFNACANLIEADLKRTRDNNSKNPSTSIVQSDDITRRENNNEITEALGDAAKDTGNTLAKIGGAIWNFGCETKNFIGDQFDINNDYKKAKERTRFILEYSGIIKYDDYEDMNEYIDLNEIRNKKFYKIENDEKSLIEAWIIGEVLEDMINKDIDVYYQSIVYIDKNGYEYNFSSKKDFCTLLGVEKVKDVDKTLKLAVHSINGCVFVDLYQKNVVKENEPSLSNQENNPRLSNTTNYRFNYNGEDRGESLVDILNAKKQEQAVNMKKAALGTYKVRKHTF